MSQTGGSPGICYHFASRVYILNNRNHSYERHKGTSASSPYDQSFSIYSRINLRADKGRWYTDDTREDENTLKYKSANNSSNELEVLKNNPLQESWNKAAVLVYYTPSLLLDKSFSFCTENKYLLEKLNAEKYDRRRGSKQIKSLAATANIRHAKWALDVLMSCDFYFLIFPRKAGLMKIFPGNKLVEFRVK